MNLRMKRENCQKVITLWLKLIHINQLSESDIEDEDDTDVPEDPENYFATKDTSVKCKKMIGN